MYNQHLKFIDLGLSEKNKKFSKYLKTHDRIIKFKIVNNKKNIPKIYYAYRIKHNNQNGPYKGGLRFHDKLSEDNLKFLASLMTWKNALANIPFGGAKGGIQLKPKNLCPQEIKEICQQYVDKLKFELGSKIDIPAPDIGTSSKEMSIISNHYNNIHGSQDLAMVTGKSIDRGGIEGRTEATGFGLGIITEKILKKYKLDPSNIKVIIHGFGNLGKHCAQYLTNHHIKIIGITSSQGGLFNKHGLDIYKIIKELENNHSFSLDDLSIDADPINSEELLYQACDILIPASIEGIITEKNCHQIKAKYIIEGSNFPILYQADRALLNNGKIIIPDILANAGGVITSYFEWCQNQQGFPWRKEKVFDLLKKYLTTSWEKVTEEVKNEDYRKAAYKIAIDRICTSFEF